MPDEARRRRRRATTPIRVARGDGSRAVDLLRALGLPHDRRRGFAETYGQPSLIPTPSEERARYVDALAGRSNGRSRAPTASSAHASTWCSRRAIRWTLETKPRNGPRAAVLLRARPGAPPRRSRRSKARGRQRRRAGRGRGLGGHDVRRRSLRNRGAPLAAMGPLRITPGTRPLLLAALAGGLALLAVLATSCSSPRAGSRRPSDGPLPGSRRAKAERATATALSRYGGHAGGRPGANVANPRAHANWSAVCLSWRHAQLRLFAYGPS